jgi:hypothetical protein
MKKILLAFSLFAAVAVNAQISNNSFENWGIDTINFPSISGLPPDTFQAPNPDFWSSSNSLSGADSLGGVFFVTQTSDAYHGSSAIQMLTDTIKLPVLPGIPAFTLTIPGFALNGKFPINPDALTSGGSTITPTSISGAGQPFTTKLGKIKGYYNYAPVFNSNTNSNDTCIVWAVLRKGQTVIAEAIFKSTAATSGYQAFEAPFVYQSCDNPDTLVILLASSVPNINAILGGATGLKRGSILKVDSIYYENLPTNFNYPPIAVADADTTFKNAAKNILVKANDTDCDNPLASLTLAITAQPTNGTAAVGTGNAFITYTPNNNYSGVDSFSYTLSDGTSSSANTKVKLIVLNSVGINEVNQVAVTLFPNPTNTVLNLQFENKGEATAMVYDMVGKLVASAAFNGNNAVVNVNNLANGLYAVQLVDTKLGVIARTKFTVSK